MKLLYKIFSLFVAQIKRDRSAERKIKFQLNLTINQVPTPTSTDSFLS